MGLDHHLPRHMVKGQGRQNRLRLGPTLVATTIRREVMTTANLRMADPPGMSLPLIASGRHASELHAQPGAHRASGRSP
jgi:hypothetical protein